MDDVWRKYAVSQLLKSELALAPLSWWSTTVCSMGMSKQMYMTFKSVPNCVRITLPLAAYHGLCHWPFLLSLEQFLFLPH